eukprot:10516576-Karenia_brevis.AAC.1
MVAQMNAAFAIFRRESGSRYFIWKPDSLEYMVTGPVEDHDVHVELEQDGEYHTYEMKDAIILL